LPAEERLEEFVPIAFADLPPTNGNDELNRLMSALPVCKNSFEALLMYAQFLRAAFPGVAHIVLSTSGLNVGEYRVWRLMHDDGTECVELVDPWLPSKLPVYSGGGIGAVISENTPRLVRDYDWKEDPHFGEVLSEYRSLIAVPLNNSKFPLSWSLMLSRDAGRFTPAQLNMSSIRGMLVASLIANLRVSQELAEANAQIQAELERMARLQRSLLPMPIPEIPGVGIAASYATFGQVGGDIYDFVPIDDAPKRWCIFLGDASGHGPSAAVVAAVVQTVLHDCVSHASGPAELLKVLNHRLCKKRIEGSFVTAVMAFFEPVSRILTYALAGHPAPIIYSSVKVPRWLNNIGGMPLGVDEDAQFDETSIELFAGESLLLYTDGITEARDRDGEMFGEDGIVGAVHEPCDEAQSIIFQLQQSLDAHQDGNRPNDDQTMVAIHVQPRAVSDVPCE
jgi:sigma-B regulation protein RsbU (phosphoserine phosphatase)